MQRSKRWKTCPECGPRLKLGDRRDVSCKPRGVGKQKASVEWIRQRSQFFVGGDYEGQVEGSPADGARLLDWLEMKKRPVWPRIAGLASTHFRISNGEGEKIVSKRNVRGR